MHFGFDVEHEATLRASHDVIVAVIDFILPIKTYRLGGSCLWSLAKFMICISNSYDILVTYYYV